MSNSFAGSIISSILPTDRPTRPRRSVSSLSIQFQHLEQMGSVDTSDQEQVNHAEGIASPRSPTLTIDPKPLLDSKSSKKGWAFPSLAVPTQLSPTTSSSSTRPSDTRLPPTPLASKHAKPTPSKLSRPLPIALSLVSSPLKGDDRPRRKKPRISSLLGSPSGSERLTTPSRVVPPSFLSASSRSRNKQSLFTHPSPSAHVSLTNPSTGFVETSSNITPEINSSPFSLAHHKSKRRSTQDQVGSRSLMSGLMGPGLLADQAGSKELSVRDVLLGKSPTKGKIAHGLLFSNASLLLSSHQTSLSKFYTALHKTTLSNTSSPLKPDINLTVRRVIPSSLSPRRMILETCMSTSILAESTEDQIRWVILDETAQENAVPKNISNRSALKEGSTVLGFRPFREIEWDGLGALIREQRMDLNKKILLIDKFLIT
ncbi:hypothetical protein [Phaffia rhodozyma]|uniref:Uncharacterized protein n=1 Tax=Phaffia rhodozyma TaxID=264483 RepID=A0A0F7SX41_PHARH|nr:hypothetical protein [Phaffia rhodozyma]